MAKPRKLILSPTRIATYLECAMKYRYVYHDKIGRFYLRARPELSLGSTLHQVLRTFHEQGAEQSREEMAQSFHQSWVEAGYADAAESQAHREAGQAMVEAYHASFSQRETPAETLFVEKGIRTDMGDFVLSGRVDRLDRRADGSLEVVDYKSGRLSTTPEEVAGNLAMNIYQLILRRNYPGTRVAATIYCLRTGVQATAEMTDAEAEEFAADIVSVGTDILARDFENVEPVPVPACEGCEFLSVCQRYWRRHGVDGASAA